MERERERERKKERKKESTPPNVRSVANVEKKMLKNRKQTGKTYDKGQLVSE